MESTEKEKDRDEIIEPFSELKGGADIGNVCHDSLEELLLLNKSESKPVNIGVFKLGCNAAIGLETLSALWRY